MLLMSRVLVLATCCVFVSSPAAAQETPLFELSGGYTFLQAEKFTFLPDGTLDGSGQAFHGWVGSITVNLSPALGLTGELGGNYWRAFGIDLRSLLVGPRVTVRRGHVSMFAQVLLGAEQISTALAPGFGASTFALQPGAGIDFWTTPNVAIHVGADYRRVFENAERPRAGSNQFRLHGGLAVAAGQR